MSVSIKIPSPLRRFTGNTRSVDVYGATVGEALKGLINQYSELGVHLFGEDDHLRSFVNVYVGGEDIRYRDGLETTISDGDELVIIPSVAGGVDSVNDAKDFGREEYLRYSRHFTLPEIGLEGQRKLKNASVLIIGAGGLGSPISLYLTAAGIGKLGIVDFDEVDLSNLQRQILYTTEDIGQSKIVIAKQRLLASNPHLEIETYEKPFTAENALSISADYDILIDGTDNFPTRYLVNDVSVFLQKPNVYGSIFQFEGQLSVFGTPDGPCYRCLYPDPPPPGLVPSCAEGGVLGVLPGTIGTLQATEAIKLITGIGQPMIGRLLVYDALEMTFNQLKLRKNAACSVCGEHPTITEPIDYEQFCGVSSVEETVSIPEITAVEARDILANGHNVALIDVREPWEAKITRIEGAKLIPLKTFTDRLSELDPSQEIIVHCKGGTRSAKAVELLIQQGFSDVKNLRGGILAWAKDVDTSLNRY